VSTDTVLLFSIFIIMLKKQVTYTLEFDGEFFLVENVSARVDEETGEQFFSPSTVEHLQQIILMQKEPDSPTGEATPTIC
jgi:hypothetical protein